VQFVVGALTGEDAGKSNALHGINSAKNLSNRISASWKDGLIE
jgi:hypothetical protein